MTRLPTIVGLAIACMLVGSPVSAGLLAERTRVLVRGDDALAAETLALRADQGDADAQAQLGFMYEQGRGVVKSYDLAVHWYVCAAEQGHTAAQYLLGLMYAKGRGVQRNDMLAYQWLNVAAARAPQRAKEYYARIRDAVAKKLTPAQIIEAQRLAAKFVVKDARMPGKPEIDR